MIKAVCRLHCLVLVGASSTGKTGNLQVPASRRHDRGCVPFALPCPCRRQLHRAVGPPSGARIDDMIKAVSSSCTALSLSAPAPQSSRATARCPRRDDMIKAVSSLHCLVFVGASSTEQSGHLQVPASRRHDQGSVASALPCLVGASSTELSGNLQVPASRRHDQGRVPSALPVLVGARSTEQLGHSRRPHRGDMIKAV